jgi:hypothetical protein
MIFRRLAPAGWAWNRGDALRIVVARDKYFTLLDDVKPGSYLSYYQVVKRRPETARPSRLSFG